MSMFPPMPEHTGWPDAPALIARRVAGLGERPVVAITGPPGAGKSTLAAVLADRLKALVVTTDDYLPDYDTLPVAERDLPEHADLALLARQLECLRAGEPVEMPVWSFHEHRRTGHRPVEPPAGPIVCEGLFALHGSIAHAVDLAVYVEAGPDTRWKRWESIERRGERGMGVEAARRFFDEVADPTFARSARDYLDSADIVVHNDHAG